jgi:hypothetical protein
MVYDYIQKGIYFSLTDIVNKYNLKENNKNKGVFSQQSMLLCKSEKCSIENEILESDFINRAQKEAMKNTRLLLNDNKNRLGIVLDYIEENNLYDILLDFQEFAKVFDLKTFTKYKICGTYQIEMKKVLTRELEGEKMFEFDDTEFDCEDSEFDTAEIDDDDIEMPFDIEDEDEDEPVIGVEVELIPTPEKPKRTPKKKVIVTEDITPEVSLVSSENFSPDLDGERASKIVKRMGTHWITSANELGKIIYRAKLHFGKVKQEFEHWLQIHCKIAYSTGMSLIKVGQMSDKAIALMLENNFTSTHVTKLQSLQFEEQQIEFLEEEKHQIDEEGTEIETKKMTAKEVQAAIRLINQKPEPVKTPSEMFFDICKKLDAFLSNNTDEFVSSAIDNNKVKPEVFTPECIAIIKNLSNTLKWYNEDFAKKVEKLFPKKKEK